MHGTTYRAPLNKSEDPLFRSTVTTRPTFRMPRLGQPYHTSLYQPLTHENIDPRSFLAELTPTTVHRKKRDAAKIVRSHWLLGKDDCASLVGYLGALRDQESPRFDPA
jgi:hypothetical protein